MNNKIEMTILINKPSVAPPTVMYENTFWKNALTASAMIKPQALTSTFVNSSDSLNTSTSHLASSADVAIPSSFCFVSQKRSIVIFFEKRKKYHKPKKDELKAKKKQQNGSSS